MTSETFAVPGLLLMLAAVALAAVGTTMPVVAVPLGVSMVFAGCAAYLEVASRPSRRHHH
jgi:uncharacterized protein YqgC (DUF456 family)